jgi:hypothetical protein
VEALGVLAEDHAGLRAALPPGFLDRPLDRAEILEAAQDLAAAIPEESLIERAKARLGSKLLGGGKVPGGSLFRSLDAIAGLTGDSVVVRAAGVLCRVRSTSDDAVIEFDGNYVAGPLYLEPALEFVAIRERFAVDELPGELSPEDKLDLVSRLVTEGLLAYSHHDHGARRNGQ